MTYPDNRKNPSMSEEAKFLKQKVEILELERRTGAVTRAKEEAARERRLKRMAFVLGELVLSRFGGGETAAERLRSHRYWGPALDEFLTDDAERMLFGLPSMSPETTMVTKP